MVGTTTARVLTLGVTSTRTCPSRRGSSGVVTTCSAGGMAKVDSWKGGQADRRTGGKGGAGIGLLDRAIKSTSRTARAVNKSRVRVFWSRLEGGVARTCSKGLGYPKSVVPWSMESARILSRDEVRVQQVLFVSGHSLNQTALVLFFLSRVKI